MRYRSDAASSYADSPTAPLFDGSGMTFAEPLASALQPQAFSCGSGAFCFWADANFKNQRGAFISTVGDWFTWRASACYPPHAWVDAHGTWGDCASSAFTNDVYDAVGVYRWKYGSYGGGLAICRGAGTNLGGVWNDSVQSSWDYSSGGSC